MVILESEGHRSLPMNLRLKRTSLYRSKVTSRRTEGGFIFHGVSRLGEYCRGLRIRDRTQLVRPETLIRYRMGFCDMADYDLEDITLSKDQASKSQILEMIEEYGVCIVDSFLGTDRLDAIRKEYETFYEEAVEGARVHTDSEHTATRYIDYDRLDQGRFEAITQLVEEPLFESVARSYFDEDDVQYPSNLWTAKSRGTPESPSGTPSDGPPYAYHFDRQNNFKFLFYLNDVGIEDGPTHFVPEYHQEYKRYRLEWIEEGKDIWDLANVMWHYHVSGEAEEKGVPIVGDAGTLVIFDTDAPHRAGELGLGHERQIMRIDTMSPTHSGVTATQADGAAERSAVDLVKRGIQNPGRAAKALSGKVLR